MIAWAAQIDMVYYKYEKKERLFMTVLPSKKVLLVDDDVTLVEMYGERLRAAGYDVTTAPNGQAGLEAAQKEVPDIILLDIMMPIMNGFDAAKAIREDEALAKTPIIFLTALIQDQDKAKAEEIENSHYLIKPETTPGELVKSLEKILTIAN